MNCDNKMTINSPRCSYTDLLIVNVTWYLANDIAAVSINSAALSTFVSSSLDINKNTQTTSSTQHSVKNELSVYRVGGSTR